jgi:competence ComEA-like helix-hairpin-helix protein
VSRARRLLSLWGVLVLGLAVRAFADGLLASGRTLAVTVAPHRIDLNTASVAELQALPGIGPTRAVAIVLERVRHGPFRCLADLGRVDGIGEVTADGLSPWLLPLPALAGAVDGRHSLAR